MKNLFTLIILITITKSLAAQESPDAVMEKRAREMHRVITVYDKEQWKKFISENYSQTLIDRPMKASVNTEENGNVVTTTSNEPKDGNNVEKKAQMYAQLNNDFGKSKLSSLKIEGNNATMKLQSPSGANGTISLRFSTTKPYLIEGLGIEIEN